MSIYTKAFLGLGACMAGFVAGALSRQPEINELKEQVRSLQAEVERLHGVIELQNKQINHLKIRYNALKGWQFVQKNKQRGYIRGSIMYQYALKEYIEMLIDSDQSDVIKLNKDEIQFYNAFGRILNAAEITDKDREVVIQYVCDKYKTEIDRFQEPDLDSVITYLELGNAV